MVDVEFDILGKNKEEAKERAGKIRTLLQSKYERDANRNDDTFLEHLERYKQEIAEALSLPPEVMANIRAKHAKEFGK